MAQQRSRGSPWRLGCLVTVVALLAFADGYILGERAGGWTLSFGSSAIGFAAAGDGNRMSGTPIYGLHCVQRLEPPPCPRGAEGRDSYCGEPMSLDLHDVQALTAMRVVGAAGRFHVRAGTSALDSHIVSLRLVDTPWDQVLDLIVNLADSSCEAAEARTLSVSALPPAS